MNSKTHTAERVEGGYIYRGFFLERCPGNQWNQYPASEAGLRPAADSLLNEGLRSLREAKAAIDAEAV